MSDKRIMAEKPKMYRGERSPVTTFLSAFGRNKEVHLTAYLAYLIRLEPTLGSHLFGCHFTPDEIYVEKRNANGDDRYDIILKNGRDELTVEAKLGFHSIEQIKRYLKNNRNLALLGEGFGKFYSSKEIKGFLTWDELDKKITKFANLAKHKKSFVAGLINDFSQHLKEQGMSKGDFKDIYIRDLSGDSVQLYFEHGIYTCQKAHFNSASRCRYFAPYLTKSNKKGANKSLYHILGVGMTYFSKIKECLIVEVKEIPKVLKKYGYSPAEINAIKKLMYEKEKQCTLFLLDNHLRLTQKPITKKDLWGHSGGAMPSMGIDFGDLMAAANGHVPFKKAG